MFCKVKQQFVLLQAQVEDLTSTISQLRDENMLLRAQANTGLGQATDASTVGHGTMHVLEAAQSNAYRWKTENEHKDSLICKLVSTPETVEFNLRGRVCIPECLQAHNWVILSCRPL
jgi:DNA-directed RNA polymerase specialized sigma54-like protein